MNRFGWVFFLALLAVGSCETTADYDAFLDTFLYVSEDDLVREFGPPDKSHRLSNGNKIIVFENKEVISLPPHTTPVRTTTHTSQSPNSGFTSRTTVTGGQKYGGYTIAKNCTTQFELRKQKNRFIVISAKWRGNACQMTAEELEARERKAKRKCEENFGTNSRLTAGEVKEFCSGKMPPERKAELKRKLQAD